jgi:hypothetical protein
MYWVNFLHIYQPPGQWQEIFDDVTKTSYIPIIKILKKYSWAKIILNISACLTEQLTKRGYSKIIEELKKLAQRGQIEFVESSKYHALLPLLPEKEIKRQIELNHRTNKFYFGKIYQPKGVHLPELAYSKRVAKIMNKLGYSWIVVDEICFRGKLGQKIDTSKIYILEDSPQLKIFVKLRKPSYFFQNGLIREPKDFYKFFKEIKEYLITVVDGEAFGHHFPGKEKVLEKIYSERKIETKTISELLEIYPQNGKVELFPATWGTLESELKKKIYYAQWSYPKHPIHKKQWSLTYLAIQTVEKYKSDPNYKEARKILDMALFSCHYWAGGAVPWWDPRLVEKGARYLSKSILRLKKVPKKIKEKVKEFYFQIVEKAFRWDESGIARRKSLKYTEKIKKEVEKFTRNETHEKSS